jgi:hypothetical protein
MVCISFMPTPPLRMSPRYLAPLFTVRRTWFSPVANQLAKLMLHTGSLTLYGTSSEYATLTVMGYIVDEILPQVLASSII